MVSAAFAVVSALFITLLLCFYCAIKPTTTWVLITLVFFVITFYYQRFIVLGVATGVMVVGLNAALPYSHSFQSCQYYVEVPAINYSTGRQGRDIRLLATHIRCGEDKPQQLPDQTVQFWDNHGIFNGLENQKLLVSSELNPVRAALNPHVPDYEKYLISQGVRLSATSLTIHENNQPHVAVRPIIGLRHAFSQTITQHLSPENAGIILALVTGNRSGLSDWQKQLMRQTGTSHILAISGLHLALVGSVAWLFFQYVWGVSQRLSAWVAPIRVGAIGALVVITGYALLSGFALPVQRAWVMFGLLLLSWLLYQPLTMNSLLLAALAVMVVEPYAVLSVGFYFSFIATFVVLWCVRLPYSPLAKVMMMQGLIGLALLPITWSVFGIIPTVAFLVNLLIIPWLGLWVLPWAILAVVMQLLIPTLATPLWALVDFTTAAMWQTITVFARLDWAVVPDYRPMLSVVIVSVVCFLLALIYRKKRWAIGFLVLFLPLLHPTLSRWFATGRWEVSPEMFIADRRYTQVLIHDGTSAVLINPGRRYRHTNHAESWQRYLRDNQLQLKAVILQNKTLSRIAAVQWLRKRYPHVAVIKLTDFPLPYPSRYCQSATWGQLQFTAKLTETTARKSHCQATLLWGGQQWALFPDAKQSPRYAIGEKATVRWQGKIYHARQRGAVKLTLKNGHIHLSALRDTPRLWRVTRD